MHKDISSLKLLLTYDRTFFRDSKGRTAAHTAAELGLVEPLEYILSVRPVSECVSV